MKKKISIIIFLTLIVSAFTPTFAVVLAKKPNRVPLPLEKIVFIHHRRPVKPPWAGGPENGNGGKEDEGHYKLLGKGIEWKKLPIDVSYGPGIDDTAIIAAMTEWDDHTSTVLFGTISYKPDASWDSKTRDGNNELVYGDYPEQGVIAVTIIWGYFSGSPKTREIIEFDIMFDTDYTWGDANVDSIFMDLQNIATHELGHGLGLNDLYESAASEETMYGYSTYGEMSKRSLFIGDIAGIHDLYGV